MPAGPYLPQLRPFPDRRTLVTTCEHATGGQVRWAFPSAPLSELVLPPQLPPCNSRASTNPSNAYTYGSCKATPSSTTPSRTGLPTHTVTTSKSSGEGLRRLRCRPTVAWIHTRSITWSAVSKGLQRTPSLPPCLRLPVPRRAPLRLASPKPRFPLMHPVQPTCCDPCLLLV